MATSRWTPIARKLVAIPQRCHFSSLTLRSSRRAAVRWLGAEAPRATQVRVSVWPAREGRARLSERTLGRCAAALRQIETSACSPSRLGPFREACRNNTKLHAIRPGRGVARRLLPAEGVAGAPDSTFRHFF